MDPGVGARPCRGPLRPQENTFLDMQFMGTTALELLA